MSSQIKSRGQRDKRSTLFYLALIVLGLLTLASATSLRTTVASALPQSPEQMLRQAWQRATDIGRYHYRTAVLQTRHPTPRLENVGRQPVTEQIIVSGELDLEQEAMQLTMQLPNQPALEVKVADGVAQGRLNAQQEWIELDGAADLFAPGGDPLGYLSAIENVRVLAPSQPSPDGGRLEGGSELFPAGLLPDEMAAAITRYAFDLNGPQYAQYMRDSLDEQLRRRGELPAGVSLDLARQYVEMSGQGEIWVDDSGLPVRQIVHISFPPRRYAHEWTELQITSDFNDWAQEPALELSTLWHDPQALLSNPVGFVGLSAADAQELGFTLGLFLLAVGFVALMVTHRRSRFVRVPVVLAVILAIVITPLLQTQQVSAFYDRIESRQLEAAEQPLELSDEGFKPYESQLKSEPQRVALASQPAASPVSVQSSVAATSSAAAQSATAQSSSSCIITDSSDCDGDGLLDNVEIYELGTWIDQADSDGDGISDRAEVLPYTVNGQTWYLDPRNPDTNGDGLMDVLECPERADMLSDGTSDLTYNLGNCIDTDGDGAPDVYDHDNDGDSVPDRVDSSPNLYESVSNQEFGLELLNVAAGQIAVVDFQIRPTDPRHLWYANNVLNWPDQDNDGQVKRMTPDTLTDDGDMLLSPLLEIEIPFDAANPTRGLPVTGTVDINSISATTPLDQWLNQDMLSDDYRISVSLDEDDGTIWLYAPMFLVQDPIGNTPVALGARVPYHLQAGASSWGSAHNVKLRWFVTLQTDEEVDDVWLSNTAVVQSYYDDFIITGLVVEEQHGSDSVIIGQQRNAAGGSANYDNYLLHLADVLQSVYLKGELKSDGSRFSVADIKSNYSSWGIPATALYLDESALGLADDVAAVKTLSGAKIDGILDAIYGVSPAEGTIANLLTVSEESHRIASLVDAVMTNNQLQVAFADPAEGVLVNTAGSVALKPYIYTSADGWSDLNAESYLDTVETQMDIVFDDNQLQLLLGGVAPSDSADARAGAVALMRSYYRSLVAGAATQLVDKGNALGVTDLIDASYGMPAEVATAIASKLLAKIQQYYAELNLNNLDIPTVDDAVDAVSNVTWALLATSSTYMLEAIGQAVQGNSSSATGLALVELTGYTSIMTASDITDYAALIYLSQSTSASQAEQLGAGNTLALLSARLTLSMAFQKYYYNLYNTYRLLNTGVIPTGLNITSQVDTLRAIKTKWTRAATIGLAISVVSAGFTIGTALASGEFEPGSPAFRQLLAEQVASVIVAGVQFVLTLIPGGQLVLGVLSIIDLLISVGCAAVRAADEEIDPQVDSWICNGLVAAFTKALSYVIHDYTPLINLENEDRLAMAFNAPEFIATSGQEGIVQGNEISVSGSITSALYASTPDALGSFYWWQYADDYIDDATFDYRFQESEKDVELSQNGTSWIETPGRENNVGSDGSPIDVPIGERFYQIFTPSHDFEIRNAGINQQLDIILTESFNIPAQDCWWVLTAVTCVLNEYSDSFHNELHDVFTYDVFPAELSAVNDMPGLRTLTEVSDDSYRLAWDERFPVLADADNDGLRSKASGGIDPNDSLPDTDSDGLSDFYEISIGYDAEEADADCDGLTDYWEALYGTDPFRSDSDNDGLIDSAEMLHPNRKNPYETDPDHARAPTCAPTDVERIPVVDGDYIGGWQIIYDYDASDNPLRLWVNADPTDPDSDDDGISDDREESYGYHPGVASSLNVLSLNTEIQPSSGLAPYVKPGDTVDYTAVIGNELRTRYARGLLQSEFPVDQVVQTRGFADGALAPRKALTMTGAINIDSSISSSLVTSMTLRAGAVIVKESEPVLVLRMNEAEGATLFKDSTLPSTDFGCGTGGCPAANGRYLDFTGGATIENSDATLVDALHNDSGQLSFTAGAWILPPAQNEKTVAFELSPGFSVQAVGPFVEIWQQESQLLQWTDPSFPFKWTLDWIHVTVTYDETANKLALYVNGSPAGEGTLGSAPSPHAVRLGEAGAVDDLQLYQAVLSVSEIRELANAAALQLDLTEQTGDVACASSCPTFNDSGASFDQNQHVTVQDDALALHGNQFTFATWIKPTERATPFDDKAASYFTKDNGFGFDHDGGQDWQGIVGYQDPSNPKRVYPSMYVSDAGRLRINMGDGSNTCAYTSPADVIVFDAWQQVTVSYDGSTFTLYLNGAEVDSGPGDGGCENVALDSSLSQIQLGRPHGLGYLYFDRFHIHPQIRDGVTGKSELRINVDSDRSSGNVWSLSETDDTSADYTLDIDVGVAVSAAATHWFRLWEDEHGDSDNDYGDPDQNLLHKEDLSVVEPGSHADEVGFISDCDGFQDICGDFYWSLSNDYFTGSLSDFRVYSYAISPEAAQKVYKSASFALQMPLDEPPGENQFTEESGNFFTADCDLLGNACPDSGIPGRVNQALRFDGGVADDDGNDGVADYATLSARPDDLGLVDTSFTVMAWVKADDLSGYRAVLGTDTATTPENVNKSLTIGVNSGKPHMGFHGNGLLGSSTIASNEWVHLAWVYAKDKVTWQRVEILPNIYVKLPVITNEMALYINGVLDTAEVDHAPFAGSDFVHVGRARGGRAFDGLMDDLRIVKKALGESEIQAMMNEAPTVNLHLDEDLLPEGPASASFTNDGDPAFDAACSGTSCPQAGDKGQIREAAVFDGDDQLTIADGGQLPELKNFTIGMWVKPTKTTNRAQWLIRKDSVPNSVGPFGLRIKGNSQTIEYGIDTGCGLSSTTIKARFDSTGQLLENQWNQVVATYNDGTGDLSLYLNGQLDSTQSLPPFAICTNTKDIALGESVIGNLDEVTVTPAALSAEEIEAIYEYQSGWFDVKEQHQIRVDVTPPSVQLDFALTYVGRGQTLAIDATDAFPNEVASGIAQIDYQISGVTSSWIEVLRDSSGCWCFTFNPLVNRSEYEIRLRATDNVGHIAFAPSVAILKLDETPPAVGVDASLTDGTVKRVRDELALSGTVSDGESGVDAEAMRIQMRDPQDNTASGAVTATVSGGAWQAVQPFSTAPYGAYSLDLWAADGVENLITHTEEANVLLDGLAPYADVVTANTLITQSGSIIEGITSDIPVQDVSRVLHLHFEEAAGATTFADGTTQRHVATCSDSACPTASSGGKAGSALSFNGSNEYLTLPHVIDPAGTSFTASTWFNVTSLGSGNKVILQQLDGTSVGRAWLYVTSDGQLGTFLRGDQSMLSGSSIIPGQWHHAAVTHDGTTLALYLDGEQMASVERSLEASDGDMRVGAHKTQSQFFYGSIDEVVIHRRALSAAELYDMANPLNVAVAQTQIRFRHASGAVWPEVGPDNVALYLPLDDLADSSRFADFSINKNNATCSRENDGCPTAGEAGQHANAPIFDGVNDYLTVPQVIDPAATSFTVAAHFKIDDLSRNRYVMLQKEGSTSGSTWLLVLRRGTVRTEIGGIRLDSTTDIGAGEWHHAAITYDMASSTLTLYLDGVPVSTTAQLAASDGELLIGSNGDQTNLFPGQIDEVVVFDRALDQTEVQALMQSPWSDVTPDTPGAIHTAWHHALTEKLEGPYKADLFVADALGNSRLLDSAWTGMIDTAAPRLTFTYADNGDGTAQVSCTAEDDFLDSAGWSCAGVSTAPSSEVQSAAWWTTYITATQLVRMSTIDVSTTSVANPTLEACDMGGNCASTAPGGAADEIPTSLPQIDEPAAAVGPALFLPLFSNEPWNGVQTATADESSTVRAAGVGGPVSQTDGQTQSILLPLVTNQ